MEEKKENRLMRNTLQRELSMNVNQLLVRYEDHWLLRQGNVAMFPWNCIFKIGPRRCS